MQYKAAPGNPGRFFMSAPFLPRAGPEPDKHVVALGQIEIAECAERRRARVANEAPRSTWCVVNHGAEYSR